MDSILTSIKKLLGLEKSYTHFDEDIIMGINSAFGTLADIGVGPEGGFRIEDSETTWNDYIPEGSRDDNVKTYIYLKVKLIFDPPLSTAVIEVYKATIKEIEWRLSI